MVKSGARKIAKGYGSWGQSTEYMSSAGKGTSRTALHDFGNAAMRFSAVQPEHPDNAHSYCVHLETPSSFPDCRVRGVTSTTLGKSLSQNAKEECSFHRSVQICARSFHQQQSSHEQNIRLSKQPVPKGTFARLENYIYI